VARVFRKTIFWMHLVAGVATGLVVLMTSSTGVMLTYERPLLAAQIPAFQADPPGAAGTGTESTRP